MKNNIRYSILAGFVAILSLAGCERGEETLGPDAEDVFGPFEFVEDFDVSVDSADFTTDKPVYFTAKFAGVSDWTITITGNTSKITKTITGTSGELNADNASWDGSADIPAFGKESASVSFKAANSDTTVSLQFNILKGKQLEGGILVNDYDGGIQSVFNPESGDSANFFADTKYGGRYFTMIGVDRNTDYWIGEQGNTAGFDDFFQIPAGVTAEDLYFNIFIYSYGEPETQVQVSIKEADDDGKNDFHLPEEDDIYNYKIDPTWDGWQLVSFKYSEAERSNNPGLGDTGNGVKEPQRITNVVINLLAKNASPSSVAKFSMEYACFTIGGPLEY